MSVSARTTIPTFFITLRDETDTANEAQSPDNSGLPLFGVPMGVKDNIDVKGLPPTAACPRFSMSGGSSR